MLNEPTMTKLYEMKLNGMAEAYDEQRASSTTADLSFEERFSLWVERQWIWKENRALTRRLAYAGLKQSASVEDLDYRPSRGLKRSQIDQLATGEWVERHQNVIVTGVRLDAAKPMWPAPWRIRPAAKGIGRFTSMRPSCSGR